MTSESEMENIINYKNLYIIPSYHNRITFSLFVREVFARVKPDAVAVELPENIKDHIITGVKRLPKLSLIVYNDELFNEYLYVPIDPCDSMIEGLRLAINYNRSYYFIDLNVQGIAPQFNELPDDYCAFKLGLKKFYDVMKQAHPSIFHLDKESFLGFPDYFLDDTTIIENIHETKEYSNDEEQESFTEKIKSLDQAREYYMACHLKSIMESHKNILVIIGLAHWERIKTLLETENLNLNILKYSPELDAEIYNVPNISKALLWVFNEIPYNAYRYERFRSLNYKIRDNWNINFDKLNNIPKIFMRAEVQYKERYDEQLSIVQSIQLNQYLRNLILLDNRLTPDLYHIVIAAKNIINDDFSWYTYKTGMYYPYAVNEDPEIPTLEMEGNKIKFRGQFIKIHRRIPIKGRVRKFTIRRVQEPNPNEDWEGEWKSGIGQYSFPPEDIILEGHYKYIRNFGTRALTERYTKIEKFNGDLMDGIDIRETIRNWINGQHIFVRETKRLKGDITCFVLIFDDEPLPPFYQPKSNYWDQKYPNNVDFHAEHMQESDLAFFATKPGKVLVGPGISIIKIGGILSEFPPQSLDNRYFEFFDPQTNLFFIHSYLKSERLLLGAIYWAKGRYILYIDKKRPKEYFYRMARINNKEIIFVPISNFSNKTLTRLKYMHILNAKFRRKYADKYIDLNRRFKF